MNNQKFLGTKDSEELKQSRPVNIFYVGFIISSVAYTFVATGHVSYIISQLFQSIGLVAMIYSAISLISFKFTNKYLQFLFIVFILWQITIILRGFKFNYTYLKTVLFDADFGLLLYFTPIILLFPKNFIFYRRLFDSIIILGIFFLIFDAFFIRQLISRSPETQEFIEHGAKNLSITCGFILLTYKYHSNKRNFFAFGVMMISLLFAIYKARRGLSAIYIGILLSCYFVYLFNTKRKFFFIYISILLALLGAFFVSNTYKLNKGGLFSFISERGDADTRTGVEIYFYNDMETKDWLIGRGINGEYFCPGIDVGQATNYRRLIETGYLQLILKGGIIRLILYLLITIPAIILGLFFSKNLLSKASSIWILIALLSLYPAIVNSFNLNYLLVWICVGICYNKKIRNLKDNDVKKELFVLKN